MATFRSSLDPRAEGERQAIRGNWFYFLIVGSVLILTGLFAISYPIVATLTTVVLSGIILMCGGVIEIASAFWARYWGGLFLHLLCGLLYLFVGIFLLERPGLGAAGYTLVLAMFFVAGGLVRLVSALVHRFSGWVWAAISGFVSLLLGMLIWRELPEAAFWVIGTFVGIDLLFNGLSWVMLGVGLRSLPAGDSQTLA